MKKKTALFFYFSLFSTVAFLILVFFGQSEIFSLKENVYKQKLISLQSYFESELNFLSKNVSSSLKQEAFISWLKRQLESGAKPLESQFKNEKSQTIEIVDYFLVNLVVLGPRGKIVYAYDTLPLNETSFYKTSFIRPEVFSIENNNTLLLTLQTEHLQMGDGSPLPVGYLLFYFDLRDIARRVFSLQEKNFQPEKVLSYRYSFVYNESTSLEVQPLLATIINKSFDLQSRWKKVRIQAEQISFQGYRLNSGINFAYIYNANFLGIPLASILGISMLFLNFISSLILLVFFKEKFLVDMKFKTTFMLNKFLQAFKSLFFLGKKNKEASLNKGLKVPESVYKNNTIDVKQEVEIVSLLQSLEESNENVSDESAESAEKQNGNFWKSHRIKNVSRYLQKNVNKIVLQENYISQLCSLLEEKNFLQTSKGRLEEGSTRFIKGVNFLAVLRNKKNVWSIDEFLGVDLVTVKRCAINSSDAIVVRYLNNGVPIFISKQKKNSHLLQIFLSSKDYHRLEGVLFFPIVEVRSNYDDDGNGNGKSLQAIIMLA